MHVLIDAKRIRLAPEIAELFEREKTAAEGVIDVAVVSAYAVTTEQEEKIATAIRARSGQQCEVRCDVDESLIGGAVIRVGDSVIDISLKGRLQALSQRLG
jgi:F-type H+-transporting ATPase subunit delta